MTVERKLLGAGESSSPSATLPSLPPPHLEPVESSLRRSVSRRRLPPRRSGRSGQRRLLVAPLPPARLPSHTHANQHPTSRVCKPTTLSSLSTTPSRHHHRARESVQAHTNGSKEKKTQQRATMYCGCKGCPAKTLWALFTILLLGGIALLAGGLVRTVPCTTDLVNCEKGLAKGSQQHTVCWDTYWTCTSGVAREFFFRLPCWNGGWSGRGASSVMGLAAAAFEDWARARRVSAFCALPLSLFFSSLAPPPSRVRVTPSRASPPKRTLLARSSWTALDQTRPMVLVWDSLGIERKREERRRAGVYPRGASASAGPPLTLTRPTRLFTPSTHPRSPYIPTLPHHPHHHLTQAASSSSSRSSARPPSSCRS
jgi:hypothetical protein